MIKIKQFTSFLTVGLTYLFHANFVNGEVIAKPADGAEEPKEALAQVPIYGELLYKPELYRRVHIHVLGLEEVSSPSFLRGKPEGYLVMETYGDDTGSNDDFPIGKFTLDTFPYAGGDPYIFEFDYKQALIYKKDTTTGVRFSVNSEDDDLLFQLDMRLDELPTETGGDYVEYSRNSTESNCRYGNDAFLKFKVRMEEHTQKHVALSEQYDITYNISTSKFSGIEYDETVVNLNDEVSTQDFQSGTDKALIQSWRHVDGTTNVQGAVLWVIGKGDCFMHPHVAEKLFFGPKSKFKMDLYVVNWRLNGLAAQQRGWLTDAYYHTHNAYGDITVYNEEVQAALDLMKPHGGGSYNKVLGYAHSTGAALLLNYIIDNGDDDFDGFVFNSPFLDFGVGCLEEFGANNLPNFLTTLGIWDYETLAFEVPSVVTDPPIPYLNRDIALAADRVQALAQYPHPWEWRSDYLFPVTAGFLMAASGAHRKIEKESPITSKPSLVVISDGDFVLDPDDLEEKSTWISEDRELVRMKYNNHDVFYAFDKEDEQEAIKVVRNWIDRTLL